MQAACSLTCSTSQMPSTSPGVRPTPTQMDKMQTPLWWSLGAPSSPTPQLPCWCKSLSSCSLQKELARGTSLAQPMVCLYVKVPLHCLVFAKKETLRSVSLQTSDAKSAAQSIQKNPKLLEGSSKEQLVCLQDKALESTLPSTTIVMASSMLWEVCRHWLPTGLSRQPPSSLLTSMVPRSQVSLPIC